MASGKGANKLMTQICPGRNGIFRQMHQPRPDIGLKYQQEVVGEYLVIASPGSLHRNGVDAEELGRMGLAIILLRDLRLERTGTGPLDSP